MPAVIQSNRATTCYLANWFLNEKAREFLTSDHKEISIHSGYPVMNDLNHLPMWTLQINATQFDSFGQIVHNFTRECLCVKSDQSLFLSKCESSSDTDTEWHLNTHLDSFNSICNKQKLCLDSIKLPYINLEEKSETKRWYCIWPKWN